LWIEQNKQEIYEPSINGGKAKTIGISQIIGANPEYDIEHTIPRSISQDNSQSNKTLCSRFFNREIKKNKTPIELQNHDLILPFVEHWKKEADSIDVEINILNRRIKAASTKENKDRSIRKRHYLSLKKAYLEDKYYNFIRKEPKTGFKNSQIPDTGIITKYAQSYLRSYFKRVESVKGGMVAEFRKLWGVQKSFRDENDKKHYEEKDRSKHTHHTIDAITIACMTKQKYDMLAHAWTLEDEARLPEARRIIESSKPWKTFAEDIAKIEEEILVSHYTPDNLKKQSKKILRVRGKKQFVAEVTTDEKGKKIPKTDANGKIIYKLNEAGQKIPRLQQGDTVRGSLHQDSIYGRVLDPETKEIRSVIRKSLESLKANDIEKIVDPEVKEIVKKAVADKIIIMSSNTQQANKIDKEIGVWMNKEKGVAINKVRIYADSVKNPLQIKKHAESSKSRHEHKQFVLGQNDENYAMAIYEGVDKKGNAKRVYEILNNIDAGKFYRLSNKDKNDTLIPQSHLETNYPLSYIVKKGDLILFYEKDVEELYNMNSAELGKRLYKLAKFDAQGRLTFRFHKEARQASDLKEVYQVDFNAPFEQIRLQVSKLNILLQKKDFDFSPSGKIFFKKK
jgi:CRISPR-associated endonuclease Csn1